MRDADPRASEAASDTPSGPTGPDGVSQARAAHERSRDPHPEGIERISYDCQTCGACCIEAGAVILDEADDVPSALVQHVANLRCMATEGTSFRCAALLGTVGRAVGCGIYARRPGVCRSFDAGSDECLSARDAMARKRARPASRFPGYDVRDMPGAL